LALRDIAVPFRAAMNGLVHTFRTQRHMRVHLYVTIIVVLLSFLTNLSRRELLVLLFMITFVLVAEMFNSAIEATVDLIPLAKFAKDIAAGAVLITTIMAVVVGLILFLADDQWERIRLSLGAPSIGMPIAIRIVAGALLVVLATVIGKGLGKHGRVLQGGLVSGHSALGFYFATCTFFVSDNLLASAIAVLLASLVAQSRYEAKFHSFFELSLGALVGVLFGVMLFGLLPK